MVVRQRVCLRHVFEVVKVRKDDVLRHLLQCRARRLGSAETTLLFARDAVCVGCKSFFGPLLDPLGPTQQVRHANFPLADVVKARLDDVYLYAFDVVNQLGHKPSTEGIKHTLRVFLRVNANTHAVLQVADVQGVAANDNRVGRTKTTRNPILVGDARFDIYAFSAGGEVVDILHVHSNKVGHLLVFVKIKELVRFDCGVGRPVF